LTDRYARFVRDNTLAATPPLVPELTLHLAGEVTPLWQATEASLEREGLPPPYWAFAWPGGQALARLLLDQPNLARGRRVLDFAAGCGIAAVAAAISGAAEVRTAEIDPFAFAAIALNAAMNGVSVAAAREDVLGRPAEGFDLILAGDVCYEKPMAERVITWLTQAAAKGIDVLVADPGRAYLPKEGLREIIRYDVPTSLDLENRRLMTTVIYRLMR
jgi:predicted nicotinamide N-methyase